MFVHSGASLHGHEYSPANPSVRRSPLVRSAFSAPPPRLSHYDSARATIRPAKRVSLGEPQIREEEISIPALDRETMSDDGRSYANSDASETTTVGGSKKKRRAVRASSTYCLANPAPTLTRQQKLLHIRPKLLLQFQRVLPDSRPIPTIDVLPSFVFVPRLAMKFPHMFRGKGELGINDVMVVKSEDYSVSDSSNEKSSSEDEFISGREILAAICQIRGLPGSTEICFNDGTKWYGTLLPNGFEFVTADPVTGEKTVARWVQRSKSRRDSIGDAVSVSIEPKFGFSILNPSARRHPILATLTPTTLNIPDFYTTVSSSAGRYPPTSPIKTSVSNNASEDEEESLERTTHPVDENLKTLIQVTAVWIALRQGWCHYFKYDDNWMISKNGSPASSSNGHRRRSNSFTKPTQKDNTTSPESLQNSKAKRHSAQVFRSSPSSLSQSDAPIPLPKRTISTGSAFMERAAAKRLSNPQTVALNSIEGEPSASPGSNYYTGDNIESQPASNSSSAPDTPTKHRRVQSVNMSVLQQQREQQRPNAKAKRHTNSHLDVRAQISSDSSPEPPVQPTERSKTGRWKSFINFLRHCREVVR